MNIKHLILILCTSCSHTVVPPHIRAADEITNPFIQNAKNKYGLGILGTGGRMMGEVETISVSFITCGEYDIKEARKHFLTIVTPFVNEIKSSVKFKPYLIHPESPEKIAHISITYITSTKQDPLPPKIAHVGMYDGMVVYSVSYHPLQALRTIYEETYQEALEKINCPN